MTHDDLEKLAREALELSEKATKGPWEHYPQWNSRIMDYDEGWLGGTSYSGDLFFPNLHDSEFIAASRTSLPTLAEAVLQLIEENRGLDKLCEALKYNLRECAADNHKLLAENKKLKDMIHSAYESEHFDMYDGHDWGNDK